MLPVFAINLHKGQRWPGETTHGSRSTFMPHARTTGESDPLHVLYQVDMAPIGAHNGGDEVHLQTWRAGCAQDTSFKASHGHADGLAWLAGWTATPTPMITGRMARDVPMIHYIIMTLMV